MGFESKEQRRIVNYCTNWATVPEVASGLGFKKDDKKKHSRVNSILDKYSKKEQPYRYLEKRVRNEGDSNQQNEFKINDDGVESVSLDKTKRCRAKIVFWCVVIGTITTIISVWATYYLNNNKSEELKQTHKEEMPTHRNTETISGSHPKKNL